MVQIIACASDANAYVAKGHPAKVMPGQQRQELAIQALAGTRTITALAEQVDVSRKFIHHQVAIAQEALCQAFTPAPALDDAVLFHLPVTKRWIQMVVLALLLLCRAPFRGVIAFCRDCLGYSLSLGTVHNILQNAVTHARQHNDHQALDQVGTMLLDEIFQSRQPVLVGVDAFSTYCFLLAQEENRDAVTWGVHLLDLQERGLNPKASVADFGSGLRAGHALALPDLPCRGDVFHALQTIVPVVTALENAAYELMTRCEHLEHQQANFQRRHGRSNQGFAQQLRVAKPNAAQAITLADDVALLARWLREEVLALAGPCYADRSTLYDFLVAELRARVPLSSHRLLPLCRFLENHRAQLLSFVEQLDKELAALAADFQVSVDALRELLSCQTLSAANPRRWQREANLHRLLRDRFYPLSEAVRDIAEQTVRASSAVENLNSRLRNYFTLRRHLGPDYLALLQFFLNHRRFDRSDRPERVGKSPAELLTGQPHPHWLAMLGHSPFSKN
jgi:hypothetical protein